MPLAVVMGVGCAELEAAERGMGSAYEGRADISPVPQVLGLDLSRAMVRCLAMKPGGHEIGVTIGSFTSARAPWSFALVYLVYNTIMNVTT